jgi:3alpha(or 20beta)-hydroxysteroid dehydrogenase
MGMSRLAGKTAIVTGGSRGMGASISRLFHREGANVVIADVLDDEGRAVAQSLGERAMFVHLDVSSEQGWNDVLDATLKRFGALHVLVNNAGIYRTKPLVETTTAEYELVVRINQLGPFLGMRTCAPAIRDAGGGSIVNLASTAGIEGVNNAVAYTASKHAVIGMTKVAALELAAWGIRINAICPGGVATPLVAESYRTTVDVVEKIDMVTVPMRRMGRPDEIASCALFLASADSSYATGSVFVIDGGLTAGFFSALPQAK